VAENPLGTYKNVPITVDSELAVDVPKTIFGETLVAELTPTVQISNPYSLENIYRSKRYCSVSTKFVPVQDRC
jgi:hypothetical protein